eukprot:GHVS01089172.1.p1 GENE.GHVS01089172.1~~GHVS01089172.1.p1  ORF type:complete len:558 (+),score=69.81 GHVS01089172.1:1-1674(+)
MVPNELLGEYAARSILLSLHTSRSVEVQKKYETEQNVKWMVESPKVEGNKFHQAFNEMRKNEDMQVKVSYGKHARIEVKVVEDLEEESKSLQNISGTSSTSDQTTEALWKNNVTLTSDDLRGIAIKAQVFINSSTTNGKEVQSFLVVYENKKNLPYDKYAQMLDMVACHVKSLNENVYTKQLLPLLNERKFRIAPSINYGLENAMKVLGSFDTWAQELDGCKVSRTAVIIMVEPPPDELSNFSRAFENLRKNKDGQVEVCDGTQPQARIEVKVVKDLEEESKALRNIRVKSSTSDQTTEALYPSNIQLSFHGVIIEAQVFVKSSTTNGKKEVQSFHVLYQHCDKFPYDGYAELLDTVGRHVEMAPTTIPRNSSVTEFVKLLATHKIKIPSCDGYELDDVKKILRSFRSLQMEKPKTTKAAEEKIKWVVESPKSEKMSENNFHASFEDIGKKQDESFTFLYIPEEVAGTISELDCRVTVGESSWNSNMPDDSKYPEQMFHMKFDQAVWKEIKEKALKTEGYKVNVEVTYKKNARKTSVTEKSIQELCLFDGLDNGFLS